MQTYLCKIYFVFDFHLIKYNNNIETNQKVKEIEPRTK